MSNPQKAIDYAYRAVHLTATTSKDITKDYYGKPVSRAYWNSCSNGGRQGLIEAQRFPDDFDGIVANAPWVDQTGFTIGAMWNQKALSETPVTAAKLAFVAEQGHGEVRCDRWAERRPDRRPAQVQFRSGARRARLRGRRRWRGLPDARRRPRRLQKVYERSDQQRQAVLPRLHAGQRSRHARPVRRRHGQRLDECDRRARNRTPSRQTSTWPKTRCSISCTIRRNPTTTTRRSTSTATSTSLDAWSKLADAKNPDLSKFKKRGGKLLMTYGWADTILQPMMGVNYYEQAMAQERPGHDGLLPPVHGAGNGALRRRHRSRSPRPDDRNDQLGGKGPGTRFDDGEPSREQSGCAHASLCPIRRLRVTGQGSIDDAANFGCVAP